MALVDYDSDSDSDGNTSLTESTPSKPLIESSNTTSADPVNHKSSQSDGAKTTKKLSLVSMLPPPKFSSPKSTSEAPKIPEFTRKSSTLGGGVKARYFDGELKSIPSPGTSSTKVSPSSTTPSSTNTADTVQVIPASVAARIAKYGSESKQKVKLNIEQQIALQVQSSRQSGSPGSGSGSGSTGSKSMPSLFTFSNTNSITSAEKSDDDTYSSHSVVGHHNLPNNPESDMDADNQRSNDPATEATKVSKNNLEDISHLLPGKKRGGNQVVNVVDFSVDDYYRQNEQLKASGQLEEQKRPVRTVASGKHQLSSLIRTARENREGLEEQFSQNKRAKREADAKYGF